MTDHINFGFELPEKCAPVLLDVAKERRRQDEKWGIQNHEPGIWALVLGEEFGEACEAVLCNQFGGAEDPESVRRELIQVAAVAVAWVEAIDREL